MKAEWRRGEIPQLGHCTSPGPNIIRNLLNYYKTSCTNELWFDFTRANYQIEITQYLLFETFSYLNNIVLVKIKTAFVGTHDRFPNLHRLSFAH